MASRAQSRAVPRAARDTSHEGFLSHKKARWAKVSLTLTLVVVLAYAWHDPVPRANGGTWLGYLLGTIGLVLILWLSSIGIRKRVITSKPFSLKGWTSAHVWLGMSLIVIGTLHAGGQLGWNVHSLAWLLMMIVILSGFWGIHLYRTLPEALSANRGEITQPQMLEAIRQLDRQLDTAAQPLARDQADVVRLSLEQCDIAGNLWQRLSASQPDCGNARALAQVRALVLTGIRNGTPDKPLEQIQFLLERKAAALAQARQHIRLKTQLELWLYIHVPTTIALLAALLAHVISVFLYW